MTNKLLKNVPLLNNIDVTGKRCLLRVDFNVPIKDGKITNNSRIVAAKPTIDFLLKSRAKVILLSHLSRIKTKADIKSGKKSLAIVAKELQKIYPKYKIIFAKNNTDTKLVALTKKMKFNEIILLENTRYNDVDVKTGKVTKLESGNSPKLAKFWASLGDVYVNDAFATIHRKHASNAGLARYIKTKAIGFLIQNELENIDKFNEYASKPIVSVIGGAKISDKISLLEKLMETSSQVLIGGAMANTFLVALGIDMGKSLYEPAMKNVAKSLYSKYRDKIMLPIDFLCADECKDVKPRLGSIDKFPHEMIALDIGPKTLQLYTKVIKNAKTIFWNGPTGYSEFKNFEKSSRIISKTIAEATTNGGFSLIGGGDTIAAATKSTNQNLFSFISTGGGATLAVIAGDTLPGLFKK